MIYYTLKCMKKYFKDNYKQIIVKLLIIFVVLVIDLVTKKVFADLFAKRYENNNFSDMTVIKNILSFTYTENVGAAFSMFSGKVGFLILFSIVFVGIFVAIDILYKEKNWWFNSGVALIIGGAIGNLIDRIFLGYVRDFISFDFIKDFAICNVADCCITVGCVCIAIYFVIVVVKESKEKKAKPVSADLKNNVGDDNFSSDDNQVSKTKNKSDENYSTFDTANNGKSDKTTLDGVRAETINKELKTKKKYKDKINDI